MIKVFNTSPFVFCNASNSPSQNHVDIHVKLSHVEIHVISKVQDFFRAPFLEWDGYGSEIEQENGFASSLSDSMCF